MSQGEIPAVSEDLPVIWEHPEVWQMGEGTFADPCSRLAYRLLTLADKWPKDGASKYELAILVSLSDTVAILEARR